VVSPETDRRRDQPADRRRIAALAAACARASAGVPAVSGVPDVRRHRNAAAISVSVSTAGVRASTPQETLT
jgi:hypothetical protein